MPLDLSSLKKAVNSLESAIMTYNSDECMNDPSINLKNTIRAGVIQNFEFTYELCWKFLKRRLENKYREFIG